MSDKPMVILVAAYPSVEAAEADRRAVMELHKEGQLGHVAASVLDKDADGKLKIHRHDTTSKHLAWGGVAVGALLAVVAPPVGLAALGGGLVASAGVWAGIGGLSGHFWKNIPKDDLKEFGDLLDTGEAALVVVAVDKEQAAIERAAAKSAKRVVRKYEKGDLDGAFDEAVKGMDKVEKIES